MQRIEKMVITFIVNGTDVPVKINPNGYVKTGRNKALKISNNTGRPVDEWVIHTANGQPINPKIKVSKSGIKNEDRLFLNLKVGVGGD